MLVLVQNHLNAIYYIFLKILILNNYQINFLNNLSTYFLLYWNV